MDGPPRPQSVRPYPSRSTSSLKMTVSRRWGARRVGGSPLPARQRAPACCGRYFPDSVILGPASVRGPLLRPDLVAPPVQTREAGMNVESYDYVDRMRRRPTYGDLSVPVSHNDLAVAARSPRTRLPSCPPVNTGTPRRFGSHKRQKRSRAPGCPARPTV